MATSGELHGLRVLVTRPAGQAERLCKLIAAAGGEAFCLPAIDILDPVDLYHLENVAANLASYDLAVFISVNAVTRGLDFITAHGAWPANVRIATVGVRSAEALTPYGLTADLVPAHRFSSEGLLALDELQDMRGQRVVIFRANGGRKTLHDTLAERGAEVDYVEVYRRACPVVDPREILPYWQPGALDVITITSNETLQNLFAMAGVEGQPQLREIPLLVVSERQAALAQQLDFTRQALRAEHASD
ncbi:MAG: uroporphyrinogen-III synthase, partial [Thiohalobacterales bacterium]